MVHAFPTPGHPLVFPWRADSRHLSCRETFLLFCSAPMASLTPRSWLLLTVPWDILLCEQIDSSLEKVTSSVSFQKDLGSSRAHKQPHLRRPWQLLFPTACSRPNPQSLPQGSPGWKSRKEVHSTARCCNSKQGAFFSDAQIPCTVLSQKSSH